MPNDECFIVLEMVNNKPLVGPRLDYRGTYTYNGSLLTPEFSNAYPVKHVFAPHGQHAIEWGITRVP